MNKMRKKDKVPKLTKTNKDTWKTPKPKKKTAKTNNFSLTESTKMNKEMKWNTALQAMKMKNNKAKVQGNPKSYLLMIQRKAADIDS